MFWLTRLARANAKGAGHAIGAGQAVLVPRIACRGIRLPGVHQHLRARKNPWACEQNPLCASQGTFRTQTVRNAAYAHMCCTP